ncbi:MAG TPA: c-type cytochrome biogenesis protein CcmI, partial [Gammaproteobacteria bacterium]
YAKAASGPPMPLAIVRTTAGQLPLSVTLDDSQAMMPQMKLSSFNQVIINARISKTGNATPSPGDLQGVSATIDPANNPAVEVVIDSVVP